MAYRFLDMEMSNASQSVQVIGIGRRFAAAFIDNIVLTLIGLALGFLVFVVAGMTAGALKVRTLNIIDLQIFANVLALFITALYHIVGWGTGGQTVGKSMMGIRVIGSNGQPIGLGRATLRYIGQMISSLVLMLGFAWVAFDERRQSWHDKIAGTLVVSQKDFFDSGRPVQFERRETVPSAFLVAIYYMFMCVFPLLTITLLTMMGPQIGEVFSKVP